MAAEAHTLALTGPGAHFVRRGAEERYSTWAPLAGAFAKWAFVEEVGLLHCLGHFRDDGAAVDYQGGAVLPRRGDIR